MKNTNKHPQRCENTAHNSPAEQEIPVNIRTDQLQATKIPKTQSFTCYNNHLQILNDSFLLSFPNHPSFFLFIYVQFQLK